LEQKKLLQVASFGIQYKFELQNFFGPKKSYTVCEEFLILNNLSNGTFVVSDMRI